MARLIPPTRWPNELRSTALVQGTSLAQPITFSGYIKGTGSFNNVVFTGTHDPGPIADTLKRRQRHLRIVRPLEYRIGWHYTRQHVRRDRGQRQLKLGRRPAIVANQRTSCRSLGQSFDILDWGTLSGAFSHDPIARAWPPASAWNTSQLYTSGVLSVVSAGLAGDYNQQRHCRRRRLHRVARHARLNDGSARQWRQHVAVPARSTRPTTTFGNPTSATIRAAGAGANAAVPEPATLLLLLSGILTICSRRWQMGRKLINV